MKTMTKLSIRQIVVATLLVLLSCYFLSSAELSAQINGYNAVIGTTTSSGCTTSNICPSGALIDASVFSGDFCAQVNRALYEAAHNGLPVPVIDARGLTSTSCTSSPWTSPNVISIPSTVLLPAGVITVSASWVLPSGTRIVGEGVGTSTLMAASGVTTLVSFCTSPFSPCAGVGVQDLSLTQTNTNSIAIDNEYAGEQSYVQRVTIYVNTTNTVTGLQIGAQNSGPYENITFYGSSNTSSGPSGPACVKLLASGVKLRGLNCIGSVKFSAAVLVDGSNDSIEDVYVSNAFTEGVVVGAGGSNNVSNDVLLNITGGGTNSVRICPASGGTGACSGTNTVEDTSILGVAKGATTTNSIMDQVTSTTLTDAAVAMYILGESVTVGSGILGYARFTTSPHTVTWGVGSAVPSGGCSSSSPNTKGALFSYTGGTGGSTRPTMRWPMIPTERT